MARAVLLRVIGAEVAEISVSGGEVAKINVLEMSGKHLRTKTTTER